MKTKEFIKRVEALRGIGEVKTDPFTGDSYLKATSVGNFKVFEVKKDEMFRMHSEYSEYGNLPHSTQSELFKLLTEYAATPVEEREEEQKFYIKFPGIRPDEAYLNLESDYEFIVSTNEVTSSHQSQFAQSEIDNFPDDVKKLVSLAEWIPVEEGDSE